MSGITQDSMYVAGGHQSIAIADTVVAFGVTYLTLIQPVTGTFKGKSATAVWITPADAPIFYTLDGTAPVTDGTAGHLLKTGDTLTIKGWRNILGLKMIRQGNVTVNNVNVTPFFSEVGL
jgi:hypothetical protein